MENVNAAQILREKAERKLKAKAGRKSNINEDEAVKLSTSWKYIRLSWRCKMKNFVGHRAKKETTKNIMHYMIFCHLATSLSKEGNVIDKLTRFRNG
jgi:hypothetical protein